MSQRRWGDFLLPIVVAASLFFPAIGQRTLYTSDEVRFSLLARGMVEGGHWLVPRIGHEIHMEKPPLFVWPIAIFSLVGGEVTEFTSTLPAALSGIAGVAGTLLLGRRLFGARAGLLASLILATSPAYVWHARAVLADMTVTLFILLSAWAFWSALETPRTQRGWMALFYLCLALAFSAKGPTGLMPILPFGAFLLSEEGWAGIRTLRPVMGVGILLLVSAPWAIAFALHPETSYVQSVLLEDYLWWYFGQWRSFWDLFFVLGPLLVGILPWSLFLPVAFGKGYLREDEPATRRKFRFLLFWVLAYLIVITFMAEKRTRYLLPMYPALALMVGWLFDRWGSKRIRIGSRLHAGLWGALTIAAALALFLPIRLRPDLAVFLPSTPVQKLLMAGALLAGGIGGVLALRARAVLAGFAAICLTMGVVLSLETKVFVPQYNRAYDVKGFSRTILSRVRPEDELVAFQYGRLSYDFYLRRTVREIDDPNELSDLLSRGRPVYFLADERAWRKLQEATGKSWPVVASATIGGRAVFLGANSADAPALDQTRHSIPPKDSPAMRPDFDGSAPGSGYR